MMCVSLRLAGVLLLLAAGTATPATAQTAVPAGPLADLRWTRSGSPYQLGSGHVVVPVGATLVVDAGVEIRTSTGSALRVEGGIEINGTASRPVVLGGLESSVFGGLVLLAESTGSLRHVDIQGGLETIRSWASSLTIEDSAFENNFADVVIEAGQARIDRTQFLGGSFTGVLVRPAGSIELHNSIVRDKGTVGVRIDTAAGSLASEIVNCTFYRNGLGALAPDGAIRAFISENGGPRITIKNTIVAENLVGVGVSRAEGVTGADVDVSYSDISENTTTYEGPVQQEEGIIFLDPEFVSSEDLHLQSTSPALDSGSPHPGVTTDLDGMSRPGGLGWDMGAYETSSACGNGVPEVGEECDDGNVSNRDDCLNNCFSASCGDGFVNINAEECDDADDIDGNSCSNQCVSQGTPRQSSTSSGGGCALTGSRSDTSPAGLTVLFVAVLAARRRRQGRA